MGKFLRWVKKKISGVLPNKGSSGGAGSPAVNPATSEQIALIELRIDEIVEKNIRGLASLWSFRSSVKYWQSVFKALAFAESNFKLNCRYVEPPSLGIDAVTGKRNTSEGLLQLSYQDAKYHACKFDWEADKRKDDFDLTKTIFDIVNNIECGMAIMNKLLSKRGHYIFNDGNYWAVLKPNNKRHKVFIEKFRAYQGGH